MDDETAEIELLQQNLNKTRQISKRMTTILDSFDNRIAKLEKSILPLYSASQILNRRRTNIENTLLKIDDVAGNQEDLSGEEMLILRGPQPGQLQLYREALDKLNANIAFKAGDGSAEIAQIADLVETGAKKLTQLYTKVVAEGSSGALPPTTTTTPSSSTLTSSFPTPLLPTLTPLVKFLRTLPLPATHPSHPAAQGIYRTLSDAQRGFAEMRGNWGAKCLDGQGKRVVVRAGEVDALVTGREFGEWVEVILATAEEEYRLLQDLAPLPSRDSVASSFHILLSPILRLFNSVLNSLVALIKKSLQRYSFAALAGYEALLSLQPQWEQVLSWAGDGQGQGKGKEKNELREALPVLRSLCLRSFPEFLADVKLGAMGVRGVVDTSTKVVEITVETVKYISKIPEVQGAVSAALLALGDGNWKMGEGVQVGMSQKLGEGDEELILEHFIHDVVSTTITSLQTISRTTRRVPFGSMFLLNNMAYLRAALPSSSTATSRSLLSKTTLDLVLSNFRTAKAGYYDSNFTPLMQAISDDKVGGGSGGGGGAGGALAGLGGGGKAAAAAKEKFVRFYDLFEEVVERHKVGRVLSPGSVPAGAVSGRGGGGGAYGGVYGEEEGEEEGVEGLLEGERAIVVEEVVSLVVPSLKRFIQRQRERKEFSKNPQKYIKRTPEEIEAEIRGMFV